MPVAALAEVMAYRDLIVEVAKELHRSRHQRRRVPRGFEDRFDLRLGRVEPGSAIPVLTRSEASDDLFDMEVDDDFSEAHSLLEDFLVAVDHSSEVPDVFQAVPRALVRRFGQSLLPGEELQIAGSRQPDWQGRAAYTYEKRQKYLLRYGTYEDVATLVGWVDGYSQLSRTFTMRIADGAALAVPYLDDQFSLIHEAATPSGSAIEVVGLAEFLSVDDTAQRILRVDSVKALETTAIEGYIRARAGISAAQRVETGWFDGVGEPVDEGVLAEAERVIDKLEESQIDPPYVYPTPDGGIRFEWPLDGFEVLVELHADGYLLQRIDVRDGSYVSEELPLGAPGVYGQVVSWLKGESGL
jgi:hypothetical protein